MRKAKVQAIHPKRPEPEGQGDWLYICVGCGYQRKAGVDFFENCPKCQGGRWSAYWLEKPPQLQGVGTAEPTGQGIRRATNLLPLNHHGNATPGAKLLPTPDDLIRRLAAQGLGCKAIASELQNQGIIVSHMTIQRRLQKSEVTT